MKAVFDNAFESTWGRVLSTQARGLDFDDAEDRATFRGRLTQAVSSLHVDGLRRLAEALAIEHPERSRSKCVRSIADAWMQGRRLSHWTTTD